MECLYQTERNWGDATGVLWFTKSTDFTHRGNKCFLFHSHSWLGLILLLPLCPRGIIRQSISHPYLLTLMIQVWATSWLHRQQMINVRLSWPPPQCYSDLGLGLDKRQRYITTRVQDDHFIIWRTRSCSLLYCWLWFCRHNIWRHSAVLQSMKSFFICSLSLLSWPNWPMSSLSL